MSNTFKWAGAFTSRGTVLGAELDSLASAACTAAGTAVDNSTNLDEWGKLVLAVTFGTAPTAGDHVDIYMVTAPDGTNYDSGGSSVDPGPHKLLASLPVQASTAAQVLTTPIFTLEPALTEFLIVNGTQVSFPSSGSTLTLYTADEGVV